jgi:hypothetical protein
VIIGISAIVLLAAFVILPLFFGGGRLISTVWRGNVYSVGYRDVYIQSVSKKADAISGLGRVYELKASHHGFGAAVDPAKSGQTPQGAWAANFFNDSLYQKICEQRGDTMCRIFYLEKDIQVSGASNYEVLDVIQLPSPGEPMDSVVLRGKELFKEYED